ncbi:hypothetical protein SteCoe_34005 [Stentor coeruleus]|uniref:Pre-mRNA processing factor 4 (PRP4)-like domain-containing protein n=1 Tax=Stentor coeruleus TaxID=5963 RepID=A0A1R2AVM9_9CILI|nr:hypothetical protein SteCoe_34005 [Stentor coeruleus]
MEDEEVKGLLKSLNEAESLPEESTESRLQRLKSLLDSISSNSESSEEISNPMLLLQARHQFSSFSLSKAQSRLILEKTLPSPKPKIFAAVGSMFCDNRLPMGVSFDDKTQMIGIAGWSCEGSIWDLKGTQIRKLEGHKDRVQCIDIKNSNILTGSFDNTIKLWQDGSLTLIGHNARVNNVKWHPDLVHSLSSSHDMTWKLWDCHKGLCIQSQDGHNRGVYALSVHQDGSLVVTGDLSGIGAVWDLRTGKHILTLKSHLKQILACDIAPNGFQVATGSEDHTVKIWDLRKKALMYTIPAHTKLVSSLSISSDAVASGSYDGFIKIWSLEDFSLVQNINLNCKVTDAVFDCTGDMLVTTSFDRTFKIWTSLKCDTE